MNATSLRRRAVLIFAAALFAAPGGVSASEAKKPEDAQIGQYIDISPVPLPVVLDRRLINYVFTSVRVNLKTGANALKLREKEPYLRDALVRAGHAQPFSLTNSYIKLDEAKIRATMLVAAKSILGPANVTDVVVTGQTPKQTVNLPRPPSTH